MLAKVHSLGLVGLEANPIEIEVDLGGGLPQFSIVGLPDATVRESRDRVRSALKNTGFRFPPKKITVNLAPAGIKKGRCRIRTRHRHRHLDCRRHTHPRMRHTQFVCRGMGPGRTDQRGPWSPLHGHGNTCSSGTYSSAR